MDYNKAIKESRRLRVFYTIRKVISGLGSLAILPVVYLGLLEVRKFIKGTFMLEGYDEIDNVQMFENRRSLASTSFENIDYIVIPVLSLIGILMIYVLAVNLIKYTNANTDELVKNYLRERYKEYLEEEKANRN